MDKVISKDGTPIAYQRSGAGPPLVLVHGAIGTYTRWTPVLPVLEEHFTVYAVERRGRGESGDGASYAIEREAEDIAALVEAIGDEVNLLGHSFGGLCALEAASLALPLRSLILYEPPPPPDADGVADRLEAQQDAGDRANVVITFLREVAMMPPHELEAFTSSPVFPARVAAADTLPREVRAADAYRFEPERLGRIDAPTLLLLGGDSPQFYKDAIETLDVALPDSRIAVLPGQQHIAMDTAPDLFTREVLSFLTGQR